MKLWTQFYDDLLPLVPGCPPDMASFHLRRAAQDWCSRTLCWREWLDDLTTEAGLQTYPFFIAPSEEIVQLLRATLDGNDLEVFLVDDLPSNWRDGACEQGILTLDRSEFTLLQDPGADIVVQVEVAKKPSNTGTGVSDEVFRQYVEQIAMGAAARLHAIPGKPYSNAASTARSEYEDAVNDTASFIARSFSRVPMRVRPHFL